MNCHELSMNCVLVQSLAPVKTNKQTNKNKKQKTKQKKPQAAKERKLEIFNYNIQL